VSGDNGRPGFADWLAGVNVDGASIVAADAAPEADNIEASGLDVRTHALVRLAAVVAAGGTGDAYDCYVTAALDQGVTLDEIAGVLIALLPTVGPAGITQAAPHLLGAIGRITGGQPAVERTGRA
jgi:4-carboxymuconolactone decarboxylase